MRRSNSIDNMCYTDICFSFHRQMDSWADSHIELLELILQFAGSSIRSKVCAVSRLWHKLAVKVSRKVSPRPALYDMSRTEAIDHLIWRTRLRAWVLMDVH